MQRRLDSSTLGCQSSSLTCNSSRKNEVCKTFGFFSTCFCMEKVVFKKYESSLGFKVRLQT